MSDPHWLARLLRAAIGVDTEATGSTGTTIPATDKPAPRPRHDSGELVIGPWVRTTGDDDDAA